MFLTEPQVVAVLTNARDAVAGDQCAVEDGVRHVFVLIAVQDLGQVGGLVCQDVDAFVQVAVAGGSGDAGVTGQAAHAAAFTEPAQYQHRLAERAQCP